MYMCVLTGSHAIILHEDFGRQSRHYKFSFLVSISTVLWDPMYVVYYIVRTEMKEEY